jgi:dienelactone hydrolase
MMKFIALGLLTLITVTSAAEPLPTHPLRDLNKSDFPFTPVEDQVSWSARRAEIRNRVLLAAGLLPMPEKTPLNAMIHGRIERDDYTVDKVIFESLPGNLVTGNLYLPKNISGKIPGVISPHGHWPNGRFMHASDAEVKKQITGGAEQLENAARSPLQARCAQLARMGCAVFFYDMLGYADSVQFLDDKGKVGHRHGPQPRGFISPEAELNLCGEFSLQTWNSVRALDFLLSLPCVDSRRIGCTGASGGGTQTMIISGIDDRITAAFPCVMVSRSMQGGCVCENANYLRIGQGNIDLAALTAPRPLGMTAANDWTKELETKGFPELKQLYTQLGAPYRVEAHFNIQFPHNYNAVSRGQMYRFFNKHFALDLNDAQLTERDFPFATQADLSVWDKDHPAPTGDQVGAQHEAAVVAWFKEQSARQLAPRGFCGALWDNLTGRKAKTRAVLRTAWQIMIGYALPAPDTTKYTATFMEERDGRGLTLGTIHYGSNTVDTLTLLLAPAQCGRATLLWLSLKGSASLLTTNREPTAAARQLLDAGYAIVCPELYLPGATHNPNVYAGRKQGYEGYAGYQYGYNPPLLAERVGDALAVLAGLRDGEQYHAGPIIIAGVEGASAIATATAALARPVVQALVLDDAGFRFAQLDNVWDVNFLPGAEKYGDLPALLDLCSAKIVAPGADKPATLDAVVTALIKQK